MKILRFLGIFVVFFGLNLGTAYAVGCDDNKYGNLSDSSCTTCPASYPLSFEDYNTYEGQCFKKCTNACAQYDWSNFFPADADRTVMLFDTTTPSYQIEFKMLEGDICGSTQNSYCTYRVTCAGNNAAGGQAAYACKPGHKTVTFKDQNSTTIGTLWVVHQSVWSTHPTNNDEPYSNVFYPIFQTPDAPTVSNKKFIGWYDSATGGNLVIGPASNGVSYGTLNFANAYGITANTTLYARYEDAYTVQVQCSATSSPQLLNTYSAGDTFTINDIEADAAKYCQGMCDNGETQNGWDVLYGNPATNWGTSPVNPNATITIGFNPGAATITIMPHCESVVNTYTVTYSCGDGATGTAPASDMVTYGTRPTLPLTVGSCTKSGYTLTGWRIDGESTDWVNGTSVYNYNSDKNMTAQWTADTYTATFDCSTATQGAFMNPNMGLDPITGIQYGETITNFPSTSLCKPNPKVLPECAATGPYAVYPETSWSYYANGYQVVGSGADFVWPIQGDLTFKLLGYSGPSTSVTYDCGGVGGAAPAAQTVNHRNCDTETIVIAEPTDCTPGSGIVFQGWGSNGDSTGTMIAPGTVISGPSTEQGIETVLNLTAQWECTADGYTYDSTTGTCVANTYTVTYSCGDGATGTAPNDDTVTYGTTPTLPSDGNAGSCTKSGYTLTGWRIDGENTDWVNGTSVYNYTSNKNMTAQWTPAYTATFTCKPGNSVYSDLLTEGYTDATMYADTSYSYSIPNLAYRDSFIPPTLGRCQLLLSDSDRLWFATPNPTIWVDSVHGTGSYTPGQSYNYGWRADKTFSPSYGGISVVLTYSCVAGNINHRETISFAERKNVAIKTYDEVGCAVPEHATSFNSWKVKQNNYCNSLYSLSDQELQPGSLVDQGYTEYPACAHVVYVQWNCEAGYKYDSATGTCVANTYTVTYSCGDGAMGTAPNDDTVTYGTTPTLPSNGNAGSCAKAGYTLSGWRVDGENTDWINGTNVYNYNSNKNMTAQWTANTYTATFNCNFQGFINPPTGLEPITGIQFGGTIHLPSTGLCVLDSNIVPECAITGAYKHTPTPKWEYSGVRVASDTDFEWPVAGDIEFILRGHKGPVTPVTYDCGGVDGTAPAGQTVDHLNCDSAAIAEPTGCTPGTGIEFGGWKIFNSDDEIVYPGDIIGDLGFAGRSLELVAKWECTADGYTYDSTTGTCVANTYTATFTCMPQGLVYDLLSDDGYTDEEMYSGDPIEITDLAQGDSFIIPGIEQCTLLPSNDNDRLWFSRRSEWIDSETYAYDLGQSYNYRWDADHDFNLVYGQKKIRMMYYCYGSSVTADNIQRVLFSGRKTVEIKTPTDAGCTMPDHATGFLYWKVENNSDCQSEFSLSNQELQPGLLSEHGHAQYPACDHKLYAHWQCEFGYTYNESTDQCVANTYTITYKPNYEGTTQNVTQRVGYYAEFTTKPANTFTRTGHIITAWGDDETVPSTNYPELSTQYTYHTAYDKDLFALWKQCEDGTQPNADGTECEPCPEGTYGTGGTCEPCGDGYSSEPGSTSIEDCILTNCPDGQHMNHGQCDSDEISCDAPYATIATRTWNERLNAYGSCKIIECEEGYHIASNACVPDDGECVVANGRGTREWNGTAWTTCEIIQCDPGYTVNNAGTACERCPNYLGYDGQQAVSSYITGCEIASCMYQGQKYALINGECEPICETTTDDTGSKRWDNNLRKCVRTCNPGYKMW